MHISSVRLGHANNSSSSHSILLGATLRGIPPVGNMEYGWDWFHLRSETDKRKYMSVMISQVLAHDMSREHAGIVAKELTGVDPDVENSYVDHQSVLVFPRSARDRYYDSRFMKEFADAVISNPNVSIRGGNDNDDQNEIDPSGGTIVFDLPKDESSLMLYARKDKEWWTLYNRRSGAKIRISFVQSPAPYIRASSPELVDVKVTDACPHGCNFCFQSSTPEGRHASMDAIQSISHHCYSKGVFEVALGGGETTLHPNFVEILHYFHGDGVTPNFTTFDMSWTRDKEKVAAVEKYAGSFAVSNPAHANRVREWNESHYGGPKAVLQIPLGCYPDEVVKKTLKKAVGTVLIPITLLGFKHHGRGATFNPRDYSWVVQFMKELSFHEYGADSVFVEQFKPLLVEQGVSEKLMVAREGAFSCYVDVVVLRAGASSYADELHPLDLDDPFSKFPYS